MSGQKSGLGIWLKQYGANMLSISRILGVSLIFWFTPFKNSYLQLVTIVIFIVTAVTDAVDGWFARKHGTVTETGKILDPVADKILILTFLPLLEMQVITSFPVFVILAREFAVSALRIRAAQLGQQVEAKKLGKLKTGMTLPLCGILLGLEITPDSVAIPLLLQPLYLLMKWVQSWPKIIIHTYTWIVVIITLISFFEYFRNYLITYFKLQNIPKERMNRMKAIIPNTFTVLNFSMGILACYLAMMTHYGLAVLCIILGIFADAVDGPLARKLNISSKFGASLDSQADLMSFGIAPTVLVFRYFNDPDSMITELPRIFTGLLGVALAGFYIFSVWYRLNRFNKQGHSDFFTGIPSPVGAALVLVSSISDPLNTMKIFPWIVLFSSLLMISHLPYAHLGLVKKRKFFLLLAVCTIFATLLTFAKLLNRSAFFSGIYAFEILFGVLMLYVISPLFIRGETAASVEIVETVDVSSDDDSDD